MENPGLVWDESRSVALDGQIFVFCKHAPPTERNRDPFIRGRGFGSANLVFQGDAYSAPRYERGLLISC